MVVSDPRPCILSPVTRKRLCDGGKARTSDTTSLDQAYRHQILYSVKPCPECAAQISIGLSE
jgi:hypothetical protein